MDELFHLLYDWIDFLWLPVTWFCVHRQHRWIALGFVLTCILTLRAQVELMESINFTHGIMPFMDSHVYPRGLVTYSVFFALFLVLAYFSPRTRKIIFFAAALSLYVLAFCMSMLVMAL